MLTDTEKLRISAGLDQEIALIRELLDCEAYRHVLMELINELIKGHTKALELPEVTEDTPVVFRANIVDVLTVLRMSQAYLCQHILNLEDEAA